MESFEFESEVGPVHTPPPSLEIEPATVSLSGFDPLFTDEEVADILVMKVDWVRNHANEIPGLQRLGTTAFAAKPSSSGLVVWIAFLWPSRWQFS